MNPSEEDATENHCRELSRAVHTSPAGVYGTIDVVELGDEYAALVEPEEDTVAVPKGEAEDVPERDGMDVLNRGALGDAELVGRLPVEVDV